LAVPPITYRVRGYVATDDICSDLEFYGSKPINDDDTDLKKTFLSYQMDANNTPQFSDVALYAQVLFLHNDHLAAAPIFEKGLTMVPPDGAPRAPMLVKRSFPMQSLICSRHLIEKRM